MAIQYQIQNRAVGAAEWTLVGTWQTGLTLALNTSGYAPGNWEVRVQARDSVSGAISNWSAPRQFTVSHGVVYDGQYRALGAPTWTSLFQGVSVLSFAWSTGGLANGQYEVQVQARDIIGSSQSFWSASRVFTIQHPSPGGGPSGPSVTAKDDVSIALFNRRFMRLVEDASSNIDTAAEAQRMADAALADLSFPEADQEIETIYFWPAQLGDLYRFLPSPGHYDQAQDWYVRRITHAMRNGSGRTTIQTRGKPIGAHADWLRREAVAGGIPISGPPPGTGPTLSVTWDPQPDFYDVTWTAIGTVQVFRDGVLIATPANTFRVLRVDLPHVYEFQASLNGQLISNAFTVPAYGVDVIVPDLKVTPGNQTTTQHPLIISSVNPQSAHLGFETPEMVPIVEMTLSNCTAVGFSGAGPHTLNPTGVTVVINRPAFGAAATASVQFRSYINQYGIENSETIVLTIPSQEVILPLITITVTPGPTNYIISWTPGTGTTVTLSIDGGAFSAPPASPITVARNAAGGEDKTYDFKGTATGGSTTQHIMVPAVGGGTGGAVPPSIDIVYIAAYNSPADTITIGWTASNAPAGATFDLIISDSADLSDGPLLISGVTSPHQVGGIPIEAKGTPGAILTLITFAIQMRSSGGQLLAGNSTSRGAYLSGPFA